MVEKKTRPALGSAAFRAIAGKEGPESYQPRAAPWVVWHKSNYALQGQKLLHLQRENTPEHTKPRAMPWADGSLALQAALLATFVLPLPLATGVFRAATGVAAAPQRGANSPFATEAGLG